MKVVVLHGEVPEKAGIDEQDVLVQVAAVCKSLAELGHQPVALPLSMDFKKAMAALADIKPDTIFNLVESITSHGQLIHMAPSMMDTFKIPYTGAKTDAMFLTSNKVLAKKILAANEMPTAPLFLADDRQYLFRSGAYIIKAVWEHASIWLDEEAILFAEEEAQLRHAIAARQEKLGMTCFAEPFIDGREFNLSLLAGDTGPVVLPLAEIQFCDYPQDLVKVVDYRAKWIDDSFEYQHTKRRFDFPEDDNPLLQRLTDLATRCWGLFNLRGYGRVDFRVDENNNPWILEINANPCLSPVGGFAAALERGGLTFNGAIERILQDTAPSPYLSHHVTGKPRLSHCSNGEITYREDVRTSDRDHVRQLAHSSGFFSKEEISIAVELVEERLSKGLQSGYYFLFAERSGNIIGYTCFGPIPGARNRYDLYWIVVHNDFRRLGAGKSLMARTEEIIRKLGGQRIYIDTSSRDQYRPTGLFYNACGYRQEAYLKDFYKRGDDKIIYLKNIDG